MVDDDDDYYDDLSVFLLALTTSCAALVGVLGLILSPLML